MRRSRRRVLFLSFKNSLLSSLVHHYSPSPTHHVTQWTAGCWMWQAAAVGWLVEQFRRENHYGWVARRLSVDVTRILSPFKLKLPFLRLLRCLCATATVPYHQSVVPHGFYRCTNRTATHIKWPLQYCFCWCHWWLTIWTAAATNTHAPWSSSAWKQKKK